MRLPVVALVGRPNVGKSALFNRITGRRVALVEDQPGTTRDRIYGEAEWTGTRFRVVDTGGVDESGRIPFAALVREQVLQAVAEADVILFVVDAREGITAADEEIATLLRPVEKPVILVANKADNEERRQAAVQFWELGVGEPAPVSAFHASGLADLLDQVVPLLPRAEPAPVEAGARIAIVGRPNVGKSMLLNAILGEERVIVSEIPGTTRDAIDTRFEHRGQPVTLVDTAGIRRRGRIERGVERHSVMRARQAIDRADVALLVMDATEPAAAQDTHIAGYVKDAHKGLVLVVNKSDLLPGGPAARQEVERRVRAEFHFVPWAPVVFVSAKAREGLAAMLDAALAAYEQRQLRIPTAEVNALVRRAVTEHPPPTVRGRRLKVFYATQAEVNPPTFVFFVNDTALVHFSYQRYLENSIRRMFGFTGTAIRLVFRNRSGEE
ncbi:MAG TPA: ribosome biogenesis GTPase Der [Dehalococcoidia bacterium]